VIPDWDLRCGLQEPWRLGREAGAAGRAHTFGVVLLPQSAADQRGGGGQAWLRWPWRVAAATTRRNTSGASAAAGCASGGAGTAERAAAGTDNAEGLDHDVGAEQPAQQGAALSAAPGGGQEPERDFEQQVEQGQRDDQQR
jgi:hypothetical protein